MSSSTAPLYDTKARDDAAATEWYRLSVEDSAARLGTAPVSGLTESDARKRLDRYGPNEVADRGGRSAWRVLGAQFTGVLTRRPSPSAEWGTT
jgi:magnesium-transporting ATPase (P-type)